MVVVEGIVACAEAATGARTASTLATTGCAVTTGMLIAEEMVPACEAVTGTAMACTTTGGGIFVQLYISDTQDDGKQPNDYDTVPA